MSRAYSGLDSPAMMDGASTPATLNPFTDTPTPSTSSPNLAQKSSSPSSSDSQTWETTPIVALSEKPPSKKRTLWRRPLPYLLLLLSLLLILIAVLVPVGLLVIRKNHNNIASSDNGGASSGGGSPSGSGGGNGQQPTSPKKPTVPITGGAGSLITTENGTTFTYVNTFGGTWYYDPTDLSAMHAQCNSWTPPLNQTFPFGQVKVQGVNLGGWLVLEPFIAPSLYQPFENASTPATDEWSLSQNIMQRDGNLNAIENHYATFITEEDFAQIAGAGLNWVRLPIPFWAVDVWPGEPFLAKVSWTYVLKAFEWARKYGIRINLDLHTIPGSQNGYNHSGKQGVINFMYGSMGYANAQRTLNYIRTITEFISQPQYSHVEIFSIINEPLVGQIGQTPMLNFYYEAYNMIRTITGIGAGNGPFLAIHDGFVGENQWFGTTTGMERLIIDSHPYQAFGGSGAWNLDASGPCQGWGPSQDTSNQEFGISIAGEYSAGWGPCGFYLNGVPDTGDSGTQSGIDCTHWNDVTQWTANETAQVLAFVKSSQDALRDTFFWTWKIGPELQSGQVRSPLWSYSLGLQYGYVPTDPRQSTGSCAALVASQFQFDGTYAQPYMTGGVSTAVPNATLTSQYGHWPPATISNVGTGGSEVAGSLLYAYTATAPIETLPTLTTTMLESTQTVSVNAGDGWFKTTDTASFYTPVAGCTYPDPWNAETSPPPVSVCTGSPVAKRFPAPTITKAP